MIKDLSLVLIFLIFLIKYILLYKNFIKQQNFFINTLSHDLRISTIAQIRGLELLEKDTSHALVNEIKESCQFTFDMINMLLNTYKYEKREQVISIQKINLVQEIINIYTSKAKEMKKKNIKFFLKNKYNINFEGDKTGFNKILSILISIAINNAKQNTPILISIKAKNSRFNIKIIYRGLYLTEEEQDRMFSIKPKFSTVGHGIKMLLCKKIIDFHNGKIAYKKYKKDLNR